MKKMNDSTPVVVLLICRDHHRYGHRLRRRARDFARD